MTEVGGSVEGGACSKCDCFCSGLKRENELPASLGYIDRTVSPKPTCKQKNPAQVREDSLEVHSYGFGAEQNLMDVEQLPPALCEAARSIASIILNQFCAALLEHLAVPEIF